MTTELTTPTFPAIRFLRKKSVMLMTGLSASGIYDLMNRGLFPQSIKLPGGKSVAWLLSDVEEWQRQTLAANSKAAAPEHQMTSPRASRPR